MTVDVSPAAFSKVTLSVTFRLRRASCAFAAFVSVSLSRTGLPAVTWTWAVPTFAFPDAAVAEPGRV
ncbi:MAG TPA: hypothetical protein VGC32_15155 [Solirubrobacterales bacterium]